MPIRWLLLFCSRYFVRRQTDGCLSFRSPDERRRARQSRLQPDRVGRSSRIVFREQVEFHGNGISLSTFGWSEVNQRILFAQIDRDVEAVRFPTKSLQTNNFGFLLVEVDGDIGIALKERLFRMFFRDILLEVGWLRNRFQTGCARTISGVSLTTATPWR